MSQFLASNAPQLGKGPQLYFHLSLSFIFIKTKFHLYYILPLLSTHLRYIYTRISHQVAEKTDVKIILNG